ncbi:MAG: rhomboid family intramembrane serine protease [Chitinophagales bacterium]
MLYISANALFGNTDGDSNNVFVWLVFIWALPYLAWQYFWRYQIALLDLSSIHDNPSRFYRGTLLLMFLFMCFCTSFLSEQTIASISLNEIPARNRADAADDHILPVPDWQITEFSTNLHLASELVTGSPYEQSHQIQVNAYFCVPVFKSKGAQSAVAWAIYPKLYTRIHQAEWTTQQSADSFKLMAGLFRKEFLSLDLKKMALRPIRKSPPDFANYMAVVDSNSYPAPRSLPVLLLQPRTPSSTYSLPIEIMLQIAGIGLLATLIWWLLSSRLPMESAATRMVHTNTLQLPVDIISVLRNWLMPRPGYRATPILALLLILGYLIVAVCSGHGLATSPEQLANWPVLRLGHINIVNMVLFSFCGGSLVLLLPALILLLPLGAYLEPRLGWKHMIGLFLFCAAMGGASSVKFQPEIIVVGPAAGVAGLLATWYALAVLEVWPENNKAFFFPCLMFYLFVQCIAILYAPVDAASDIFGLFWGLFAAAFTKQFIKGLDEKGDPIQPPA